MVSLLLVIQILTSLALVFLILLQGRGAGLSSAFGGGGETFRTRRGVEKLVFYLTIAAAVIFCATLVIATLV